MGFDQTEPSAAPLPEQHVYVFDQDGALRSRFVDAAEAHAYAHHQVRRFVPARRWEVLVLPDHRGWRVGTDGCADVRWMGVSDVSECALTKLSAARLSGLMGIRP